MPAQYEHINALGNDGVSAIPKLLMMLNWEDQLAREAALDALRQIGTPAVLYAVKGLWNGRETLELGFGCSEAETFLKLRSLAAPRVSDIASILMDANSDNRWAAAYALGLLGSPSEACLPSLASALNDEHASVRLEALRSISNLDCKDRLLILVNTLQHPDLQMRIEAAQALSRIEILDHGVLPLLLEALHDKKEVRHSITAALLNVDTQPAEIITRVFNALSDTDWQVQEVLVNSFAQSFGEAAVPVLGEMLTDSNSAVRRMAAHGLGEIGSSAASAVPQLIVALDDAAWFVRWQSIRSLGCIGSSAAPALAKLSALTTDEKLRPILNTTITRIQSS